MYIEGIVSQIDTKNLKVKLTVPEWNNMETEWLSVPQLWTIGNKSRWLPEKDTLMGAVLNEDLSYGAILGAIYNDEDKVPEELADEDFIMFEDGAIFSHKKDSNEFVMTVAKLKVSGDVEDKNGTMQAIRDKYDLHQHTNGNAGSNTGSPIQTFG